MTTIKFKAACSSQLLQKKIKEAFSSYSDDYKIIKGSLFEPMTTINFKEACSSQLLQKK